MKCIFCLLVDRLFTGRGGAGALKLGALNGSLRYSLNDVQPRLSGAGGGGCTQAKGSLLLVPL